MKTIIVRYAEIALKGQNKGYFVSRLVDNICRTLEIPRQAVTTERGQLVIEVDEHTDVDRLGGVFGVAWYAPAQTCKNDLAAIDSTAAEMARSIITSGDSFAVRSRRANKRLGFTSKDIEIRVGASIQDTTGASVDLDNPDHTVHIYVHHKQTYIHVEKRPGPGGLPVGVSGRVLCLLSGGFDSIAAAYLLAKRGAQVDFLHFYALPNIDGVHNSKIRHIVDLLGQHTLSNRLYVASYVPFQMATLSLDQRQTRHELVVFRRFMARVGEHLARKHDYQALALGDSLGQVASQTMENISAVTRAVELPIFRPVIGYDKQEVIDLVKTIGLYDLATEPYKDCCSLISLNPAIRADYRWINRIEDEIEVEKLAEMVAGQVDAISLATPEPQETVG